MAYTYIPPILAVDAVIFTLIDGKLSVLLHQRANEPFKGEWALPGAYCSRDQRIIEALAERVQSKVESVQFRELPYFEQLYTFDAANRDPRGPTVSVAYLGLSRPGNYFAIDDQGAQANSAFFAVDQLPKLAFDHQTIVAVAVDRLRSKLLYTDMAKHLVAEQFSLSQLQAVYEAITGQNLDKRNFRKRMQHLDLIEPTGTKVSNGAHRPAELYRFIKH